MIAWLCALPCEAQALLERFQLPRLRTDLGFRIYADEAQLVAIIGIGPEKAKTHAQALLVRFPQIQRLISFGLCGAPHSCPIGTAYSSETVSWHNHLWTLQRIPGLPAMPLTTLVVPATSGVTTLVDMEAGALAEVANSRTLSTIKIVSDHADSSGPDASQALELLRLAIRSQAPVFNQTGSS